MRSVIVAAAIVLLAGSTAFGACTCVAPVVAPAPVVYSYWPVGPVYTYPAPVMVARPVVVPPRVVVARPVVVPPRVVVARPVVAPAPVVYAPPVVYGPPVVVPSKVYVRGQPVRNVVRAVLP